MMNKLAFRIAIPLAVILFIVIILLTNRSPFGKDNSSFAIDEGKDISKIEMSSGRQKLTIEKKGETWMINNKTEARKNGINLITRILKEIRIKSPVSSQLFESEITAKNVQPVKVRIFEHRKLLKSFLVYKTQSNIYGNIMKIRESSKPFIVCIPGFDQDIGSEFMLNELYWQSYTIINLLPSEIESVSFENISDPGSSFRITGQNPHFTLSGAEGVMNGWDTLLVGRYLSYFARVPFESWALDLTGEERSRIISGSPLYRIEVKSTGGKSTVLTLWPKMSGSKGNEKVDSDRLYGKTGDHDELFIMRYFDIDPLIKRKSYFFTR